MICNALVENFVTGCMCLLFHYIGLFCNLAIGKKALYILAMFQGALLPTLNPSQDNALFNSAIV